MAAAAAMFRRRGDSAAAPELWVEAERCRARPLAFLEERESVKETRQDGSAEAGMVGQRGPGPGARSRLTVAQAGPGPAIRVAMRPRSVVWRGRETRTKELSKQSRRTLANLKAPFFALAKVRVERRQVLASMVGKLSEALEKYRGFGGQGQLGWQCR